MFNNSHRNHKQNILQKHREINQSMHPMGCMPCHKLFCVFGDYAGHRGNKITGPGWELLAQRTSLNSSFFFSPVSNLANESLRCTLIVEIYMYSVKLNYYFRVFFDYKEKALRNIIEYQYVNNESTKVTEKNINCQKIQ